MSVDALGSSRVRMAQPLAHPVGGDTRRQELRGVGVPKLVDRLMSLRDTRPTPVASKTLCKTLLVHYTGAAEVLAHRREYRVGGPKRTSFTNRNLFKPDKVGSKCGCEATRHRYITTTRL